MKPENIFSALSALRQEGRLRQVQDLRMETASLGVDREGKRYIVFNSNDYLGMTHAKEVQEAAAKAVRFGTGSGGARLTSGAAFELSNLEKEIADFKHTEDASSIQDTWRIWECCMRLPEREMSFSVMN